MRNPLLSLLAYVGLCWCVLVVISSATDADLLDRKPVENNELRAAQVELSSLDTATTTPRSQLFSIHGLVPGGFAVSSLRVLNKSSHAVQYQISLSQVHGDNDLCEKLSLTGLKNWKQQFSGALATVIYEQTLPKDVHDDLVFSLALAPEYTGSGQTCTFVLKLATVSPTAVKLFDVRYLESNVTTR